MTARNKFLADISPVDARDTLNGMMPGATNLIDLFPGDSRTAQEQASGITNGKYSDIRRLKASGIASWALAFTQARGRISYFGGISANTVAQYTAADSPDPRYSGNNLAAALSAPGGIAFFPPGFANDIGALRSATDILTQITATYDAARAVGKQLIICSEIGSPSFTDAQIGIMNDVMVGIEQYCRVVPRADFVDISSVIWDLTSATGKIVTLPSYGDGGPHVFTLGAMAAGRVAAKSLDRHLRGSSPLVRSSHQTFAKTNGTQLNQSPLYSVTKAKPSDGGGITYLTAVPTGMTFARGLNNANGTGGATFSVELIDDPKGYGKALKIVANFTQSGEYVQIDDFFLAADVAALAAGDRVRAGCDVSVVAGSANATAPWVYLRVVSGGNIEAFALYNDPGASGGGNVGVGPATAYDYQPMTGFADVPGTVTAAFMRLRMQSVGAGQQTAIFSRSTALREKAGTFDPLK